MVPSLICNEEKHMLAFASIGLSIADSRATNPPQPQNLSLGGSFWLSPWWGVPVTPGGDPEEEFCVTDAASVTQSQIKRKMMDGDCGKSACVAHAELNMHIDNTNGQQ